MSNTLVAKRAKRNPNIEVFRCLLMFLIVLHHCAYCGYFKDDDSQWLMLILFTGLTMWHVDGFIAISGWFGVRFSRKKFMTLWGEMAFYTLLSFFWAWGVGGSFSIKSLIVNGGWFGGTYLMFMFFAPLLNEAIESAVEHGTAKKIWWLMATSVTLSWAPLHLMSGCYPNGGVAFSLVIFLFVYVTARFARLLDLRLKWRWLLYAIALYLGLMLGFGGTFAIARLVLHKPFNGHVWHYFTTYDAPHVWLMAMVLLMAFAQKIRVWNWLGRVCAICGPSMFGVYLFHKVTVVGPAAYCLAEKNMAEMGLHPLINVLVAAIMTFVLSLSVDFVRRGLVLVIKRAAVAAKGGQC